MASANEPTDQELRGLSLTELLRRLGQDMGTLVRQEAELAKAELRQKVQSAGASAGMFAGAYVAGMLAAGALTACFILALAEAMPGWLAALIVAVVYGVVAAVLAARGRDRLKEAAPPVPEETVETVKEDVQWLKNPTRSESR
jgi:MFS family permease